MVKKLKKIKYLILIIILVIIIIEADIVSFGLRHKPIKSDCIIVLGCSVYGTNPSPFLQSRLMQGINLFKQGYAEHIIVSGGMGPGEDISEAEAMKKYILSKGLKEEDIIMEDRSKTTMENLSFSKEKMKERNFNSAIIVSNKYHLKRISLMAKKLGLNGSYSGVFLKQYKSFEVKGFIREVPAIIKYYILKR
jgi:uncharacterized SAM-binding protein YcdF (DUF218 family)